MKIGLYARKFLGAKYFPIIGRYYRSIFVDLEKISQSISKFIPDNALVLDIGGGDGEPLNHLMAIRNDIHVTIIDIDKNIGNSINNKFRNRVSLLPETSIRQFIDMNPIKPDCIIIMDVIHHIPKLNRNCFFRDLFNLIKISKSTLLIKDEEPGYFISRLGYLADRYISGDKNVSLISKTDLSLMINKIFEKVIIRETNLFSEYKPHYMLHINMY